MHFVTTLVLRPLSQVKGQRLELRKSRARNNDPRSLGRLGHLAKHSWRWGRALRFWFAGKKAATQTITRLFGTDECFAVAGRIGQGQTQGTRQVFRLFTGLAEVRRSNKDEVFSDFGTQAHRVSVWRVGNPGIESEDDGRKLEQAPHFPSHRDN